MTAPKLHPWLQHIIQNPDPQEFYVQLRRFIPGNDTRPSDTIINYVKLLNILGNGNGGGSPNIWDWEVGTTYREIILKPNFADFGPITELPPGVVIEPNRVSATVNQQTTFCDASMSVGEFSNPGDFYFYWKPEPIQGSVTFASNSIQLYDVTIVDTCLSLECQEGGGIYAYVRNAVDGDGTILPNFVMGQPILIEYSSNAKTFRFTTPTETATIQMSEQLTSLYRLLVSVYTYVADDIPGGTASAHISSSDNFGSGAQPDTSSTPFIQPLYLYIDDPLPALAKPGDILYVVSGGLWGRNNYDQKELALVIANGVVHGAAPLGVNRSILQLAIDNSCPRYEDMYVSIGAGGDYPGLQELYDAIGSRAWSGGKLNLRLKENPFNGNQTVRLHFPSFESVTIRTEPSIVGNLNLGFVDLEIIGGDTPVLLKNFNVDTLGSLVGEFIQLSQSQINTQGFCLNRWSASGNSSVNVVETPHWNGAPRSVQKELRNCLPDKIPANEGGGEQPSSLTVNSSPLDTRDVEVLGSSLDFTLTTTHPVKTGGGVIKSLDLTYTGGDGETYLDGAPITASGGSVVYVKSLYYGNANIRFAVAVQDGGIISVNTSKISGTLPPIAYANQLPNVPNDSGLVMMDTAIPANAQIIPLSVYRSSETVVNGNNLASFYVPYPLHLIGVRAALDTAPVGTDSVSVSLTGVAATPDYLIGPILISADQNANGEGMNVVLNPTDVIIEGTRLIVNVPAVDGSTAKGLTVYLIVIPAEISPRPV